MLDQFAKWRFRSSALASLGLSARDASALYNSRCLTVLSYVSQFEEIPKFVCKAETALLNKVLRLPGQALRFRDIISFPHFGGPAFKGAAIVGMAALIRTASKTVTGWWHMLRGLQIVAAERLPALAVISECFSPAFWDECPIVLNFHRALAHAAHISLCPPPPPLVPVSTNPFSLLPIPDSYIFQ